MQWNNKNSSPCFWIVAHVDGVRRRIMYLHNQFLPKPKWSFNRTTSHAQVCEGLHDVAAFVTSTTFSGEKEQNQCLGAKSAMQCELHPIFLCWGQFCAAYSVGKNMKIYLRYAPDVAVSKDESPGSIYYPEGTQQLPVR